jgi:hypothetical protein
LTILKVFSYVEAHGTSSFAQDVVMEQRVSMSQSLIRHDEHAWLFLKEGRWV